MYFGNVEKQLSVNGRDAKHQSLKALFKKSSDIASKNNHAQPSPYFKFKNSVLGSSIMLMSLIPKDENHLK